MTLDVRIPDPTDLAGLRARLAAAPGTRQPIGLRRIRIDRDALDHLVADVADVAAPGPILVLMDGTPMTRAGVDLKSEVVRRLGERFDPRPVVLGADRPELHADEAALAEADAAIAAAMPGCVVAVGSGTVTDIAKDASHRAGGLPFVVVETAVSVNAFSDDMAVLLRDGVKRTVPSRWPDVLLVDLAILADSPPAMTRAGFGELISMFTAPADWTLAGALGMDPSVDPAVIALFRDGADGLLAAGARVAAADEAALAELARRMTLTGIAMGVAGRTAPLSGTEHLASHLIDMAGGAAGRPLAFHGAQVGVAASFAALVWHDVLGSFDPAVLATDRAFPVPAVVEPQVRDAFIALDPSGRMGEECWRDVSRKLARWHEARPTVEATIPRWPALAGRLRELVAAPVTIAAALADAGAARRFDELDPPAPPDVVRWAMGALPLMRDRFTVVDLLWLTGGWTAGAIDDLLARHRALGTGG